MNSYTKEFLYRTPATGKGKGKASLLPVSDSENNPFTGHGGTGYVFVTGLMLVMS